MDDETKRRLELLERTRGGALLDGMETGKLLGYAGSLHAYATDFRAGTVTVEQHDQLAEQCEWLAGQLEKLAKDGSDRLKLANAPPSTSPRA